jgi:MFS family permease
VSGDRVIPLVVVSFGYSLAWSFTHVAIPFYVHDVSPYDPATTLRWTGWIMGIPYPLTIVTTPWWIRLARHAPRRFLLLTHGVQGVLFLLLGLSTDLTALLAVRALLGAAGPATVFAFMVATRTNTTDQRSPIAAMQSAGTLGQVLGPLFGALGVAHLGYTLAFAAGAAILLLSVGPVAVIAVDSTAPPPERAAALSTSRADILALGILVFVEFSLVSFLGAVLPTVLGHLEASPERPLDAAGVMLFVSAVTFAGGTLLAPRLARRLGDAAAVRWCHVAACGSLLALASVSNVGTFTAVRAAQTFFLGPAIALTMTWGARHPNPQAIGLLNSARMTANLAGPVLATMTLSYASPARMFVVFALIGLSCVALVPGRAARSASQPTRRE